MLPTVEGVDGNATEVAAGVQQLLIADLKGPFVQAVALEARVASQAAEEARRQNCDRIVIATLVRKRGGGLLGVLTQAGAGAAWYAPVTGTGSAVAWGASVGGAQAASTLAANTRAKDEMRFEFRVASPDGKGELGPRQDKVRAQSDGEDLVTPLVRRAAEAIVAAIVK
jgi:hypothetical protein